MTTIPIRDVSLFVKVIGHGYPLLIMHGGPGLDHSTMLPLQPCADQFTLIFYDHRCNGRSEEKVPTLVLAGRDDFLSPPEHQSALAAGIANARLEIIERAGHNPHSERSAEVIEVVKRFLATKTANAR
jgi:pimeloyl-ACP methyl ester carboxylesterase